MVLRYAFDEACPPVNINIVRCDSLMMIIFLPNMNTLLPIVAALDLYLGEGSLAVGSHFVSPNARVSVESRGMNFPGSIAPPVTIKFCYDSL